MDAAALGLAAGAVLSGLGSFVAATASLRTHKRKLEDECDKRIEQLNMAFERGMRVERRRTGDDDDDERMERWSHLP